MLEEGAATPGGIRPRFYDLVPALVYGTVNVPDLAEARRFFVDTLGLEEEPDTALHPPELEALWGSTAPGATASSRAAATSTSRPFSTSTRSERRCRTTTS